jgi:EmrB/QacA subfamily drug resistance transporter
MAAARYSFLVPLIVGCTQFMHQFDGVAIATALPAMALSMNADPLRLNLAITTYLMTLAVFVPISGWMAGRFGAKRIYLIAIVVFVCSSCACALSQSLWQLVAARIVQGIGGAMMTPVGRVIVVKSAPRTDIVKAMTYITIPAAMAPLFGPSVGGFVVTYFSWHWIFLINIPIGLLGLLLVWWKIPDVEREPRTPLDAWGFTLVATGIACLMLGFEVMGRGLVSAYVIMALLAAGLICATLYVRRSRRIEFPIIDLSLLRIGTFRASVLAGGLFYMGTTAFVFLLTFMLQLGFGYSAFAAGATTLAGALGSLVTRFVIRQLLTAFGFRTLLVTNGALMVAFLIVCGLLLPFIPYPAILVMLFFGGLARSTQFAAIQSMAYADMPRALMGRATSFGAMAQQLSQSFGVGLAALTIHMSLLWNGGEKLTATDIASGFMMIALAAFASLVMFARMPANAGAALGPKGEDSGKL